MPKVPCFYNVTKYANHTKIQITKHHLVCSRLPQLNIVTKYSNSAKIEICPRHTDAAVFFVLMSWSK